MRRLVLLTFLLTAIGLAASCLPDFKFGDNPGGAGGAGGGAGAAGAGAGTSGASSTCLDGALNGTETDKDCGGKNECERCAWGKHCIDDADCKDKSCLESVCKAPHCVNEALDEGESAVDCGSYDCPKCGVDQHCDKDENCKSNACDPDKRTCIPTGCDDEEVGGHETDVDCGGDTFCPRCDVGKRCKGQGDCLTGRCADSTCMRPECLDEEEGEGEEQIDCGGICPKCNPELDCKNDRLNGLETDRDCGGSECDPCEDGKKCLEDRDCQSAYCLEGKCTPAACREDADACGGGGGSGTGGTGGSSGGGTGGTANGGTESGGTAQAGTGSTSGTVNGGTAGTDTAGTGGTGDPPLTVCTGCARLVVPLSAAGQIANYVLFLNGPSNFNQGVITFRVYKEAGNGGGLKGYVQYGGNPDFRQVFQAQGKSLKDIQGWTEFSWDVGAQAMTNFDKSNVSRIGIEVASGTETEGPWSDTVIYVDSISVSGVGGNPGPWEFPDMSSISQGSVDPPKNVLWRNAYDNPVSGSVLEWLGGE